MRNESEINGEYMRELRDVRRLKKEIRDNENGQYGNETERNQLLRDLERKWTSRVDDYRREAMEARQEALRQAKKQAFNLSGSDARNAVQMADSIPKDNLEKEYRKASERSDTKLQHAIAYRGYKEGKGDLLEQWANESPASERQVTALRQAEQTANDVTDLQNTYTSYGPIQTGGDEEWLDGK